MYYRGSLGQDRFYEVQVGNDGDVAPPTASIALFRGDDALALWLTVEQLDGFIDALTRARLALPPPVTTTTAFQNASGSGSAPSHSQI